MMGKPTSFTSDNPAFNLDGWNLVDQLHWRFLTSILSTIKAQNFMSCLILEFDNKGTRVFIVQIA